MTRFEVTTRVAAPPRRVFALCLDVGVHTASMAGSGERVVGGVASGRMGPGDVVTFQARHLGLRWRMTARVTAFGPLGRLAERLVLDRYLPGLIADRAEHLRSVAERPA
ncbi:hypothetical protein [Lentzea sp. NPDC059081]|uniref:hypothetical protein n=1 Tax=Lentzea sp. NPDC059081 TaxID=3346719 RepID=UPI003676E50A